ncbi:YbaK/EbsC family protein [Pseudomonas sp. B21-048]|uniref:YbaK/EbsC family protein n=1 Tax=Pseudomonas sp. B21-048 TaxID=2895490 RepID=UPI00215E4DBA|nr:YbaK/EbsC family protein [Pseudomonas sp. B21-048]UVK97647.1 YbaK/prolyl-tRNA synthetase associated domain-containing protein [Pseudomonas sp. B21-048]
MTPHQALIDLLDRHQCRYRLVQHACAGKSVEVAIARGTEVGQGAKALVCSGTDELGKAIHALAVLPADRRLNLGSLAMALGVRKMRLADKSLATDLTGCEVGMIPPFSFHKDLVVVLDPDLTDRFDEIAFNAASFETSAILNSEDYLRVASPLLHKIQAD